MAPIGASRTGASHRRAGRPCQDAVLCRELRDPQGQPVMVMAVADGHGGSRYRRSEVGSRLACEVALDVVQGALASGLLGGGDGGAGEAAEGERGWSRWLERELPEAIQRRWLEAVEAHWHSDPGEGGFEPLLYGSTLGLVVMTARWWGHTGLGDWDLVRVEADGRARLLQEENEPGALGEATCSLCQPQAADLFARRAALHPITTGDDAFALVLCTDGIRKSCATDADFLTLAAWLARCASTAEPEEAASLPAALDRISREGSGDDVTVAIGWAAMAGPMSAAPPLAGAEAEVPEEEPHAQVTHPHDPQGLRLPHEVPRPPRRRPAFGRAVATGLAIALAGGAALLLAWPHRPVPVARSAGLQAAEAEAARLCGGPSAIPGEIRRRGGLLTQLHQGRGDPQRLRAHAAEDPLAALIALGFDAGKTPVPAPVRIRRLQAVGACDRLIHGLEAAWGGGAPAITMAP